MKTRNFPGKKLTRRIKAAGGSMYMIGGPEDTRHRLGRKVWQGIVDGMRVYLRTLPSR